MKNDQSISRMTIFLLLTAIVFLLAGCGNTGNVQGGGASESKTSAIGAPENAADDNTGARPSDAGNMAMQEAGSHVLIAYFSAPDDVDTVDAIASASIVVKDGEKLGNTEYVARLIQKTIGGDLFRIETVEEYKESGIGVQNEKHFVFNDNANVRRKRGRADFCGHGRSKSAWSGSPSYPYPGEANRILPRLLWLRPNRCLRPEG